MGSKERTRKWDKRAGKEVKTPMANFAGELRIPCSQKCATKETRTVRKVDLACTESLQQHGGGKMRGSVPWTVLFTDYPRDQERANLTEKHLPISSTRWGRFVADFSASEQSRVNHPEIEDGCTDANFPLKRSITSSNHWSIFRNRSQTKSWSKKIRSSYHKIRVVHALLMRFHRRSNWTPTCSDAADAELLRQITIQGVLGILLRSCYGFLGV